MKISTLLLSLFTVMAFSSCNKQKGTIAKIYVIDDDNNRVPGATVILKGVPSLPPGQGSPAVVPPKTAVTNSTGEATFVFEEEYQRGQAGVSVLNIVVTGEAGSGQGIIKIVEETTSEETVFVQL